MTQEQIEKNIANLYELTRTAMASVQALSAIISALPETAQIDPALAHDILDGIMSQQQGAEEVAAKAKAILDMTLGNAKKANPGAN